VALEIDVAGPPPPILADAVAIEQALNNLIVNAVDAAAGHGEIGGRVVVRLARREAVALVEVEDNGPGVAPEIVERLFEPFETTKPKGLGLGLPLTLRIARRHSGELTWRALRPHGAAFILELPIHGPQEDAG